MADLRFMILSYPQVLGLSLEDNLRPKIDYLLADPTTTTTTTALVEEENIEEVDLVLEEKQQQISDSQEEGNEIITLTTTEEEAAAAMTTTTERVGGGAGLTRDELKEFVLYQPALLAYSLEKRIRPRIGKMTENGIRFSYSPPHLMSMTDVKFNEWLTKQTSTWSIE
mmetsp:Transcript_28367/g.42421  ORF Transcript_28367/g.42421 Transcript_28367/m.42421 type:complete len:168 (-) Transcript_28367:129-632(-)